jgi:DNA-binding HxlR family transcriptional regulator
VNVAVETVGDPWTLLVIRDIVFYGKTTFSEFLASDERITTSVLADRLARLVREGIADKAPSPRDRRSEVYSLADKGLALIPVLIELANWGVSYGPEVTPNRHWVTEAATDPVGLRDLIHATAVSGGAVWRGRNSVIAQLEHRHDRDRPDLAKRTTSAVSCGRRARFAWTAAQGGTGIRVGDGDGPRRGLPRSIFRWVLRAAFSSRLRAYHLGHGRRQRPDRAVAADRPARERAGGGSAGRGGRGRRGGGKDRAAG